MLLGATRRVPRVLSAIAAAAMALLGLTGSLAAQTEADGIQFDDWRLQCGRQAEGSEGCWLTQVMLRQDDQRFLAEIRLGLTQVGDSRRNIMVMRSPPGILLTSQAAFRGGTEEVNYPLTWHNCTETRCTALRVLEPEELQTLRNGLTMVIGYQRVGERDPTVFEVSLLGITRGLAALEESRETGSAP